MPEVAGSVELAHEPTSDLLVAARLGSSFPFLHDPSMTLTLLERDQQLSVLQSARERAAEGEGCLVLVGGEAGVGKSALVRAFLAEVEGMRVSPARAGRFTPRPLGPIVDVAVQTGDPLASLIARGPGHTKS